MNKLKLIPNQPQWLTSSFQSVQHLIVTDEDGYSSSLCGQVHIQKSCSDTITADVQDLPKCEFCKELKE